MQIGAPQGQMPQGPGMGVPPPQQPTPEQMAMLSKPSWEEVIGLLRDNVHRGYRIDIETDSTIAGSLESDMQGLAQVTQAVAGWMKESGPLVQSGMLPIDAAKEIMMTITRRARMGTAVEDALDKMQAPQPSGPDPAIEIAKMKQQGDQQKFQAEQQAEMQKMQVQQQLEAQALQMQAQADERAKQIDMQMESQRMAQEAQFEQQRQQNEMAVEQSKQAAQAAQNEHQNQLEAQRAEMQAQRDAELERMRMAFEARMAASENQLKLLLAQMNNEAKIEVAEVGKMGGLLSDEQTTAAEAASND